MTKVSDLWLLTLVLIFLAVIASCGRYEDILVTQEVNFQHDVNVLKFQDEAAICFVAVLVRYASVSPPSITCVPRRTL